MLSDYLLTGISVSKWSVFPPAPSLYSGGKGTPGQGLHKTSYCLLSPWAYSHRMMVPQLLLNALFIGSERAHGKRGPEDPRHQRSHESP